MATGQQGQCHDDSDENNYKLCIDFPASNISKKKEKRKKSSSQKSLWRNEQRNLVAAQINNKCCIFSQPSALINF